VRGGTRQDGQRIAAEMWGGFRHAWTATAVPGGAAGGTAGRCSCTVRATQFSQFLGQPFIRVGES
jgi:hypothetical protein